ncbi:MAG: hypothetical protein H0W88_10580 [Parachlamydiaceae bacterium]|nr:hypothetical protein [Parachlamydiaceae bacterium]
MCFSASASFTAAALLTAVGCINLKKNNDRNTFFLAAIPLLFAIQQGAEGLLWLAFGKGMFTHQTTYFAEIVYLTFAFIIWPIWIPLSLGLIEKVKWRKYIMFASMACGVILSMLNLSYALNQEVTVKIVNQSIQYIGVVPSQTIIYPLILLIPCFITSLRNGWIFGALVSIAYIIADYYFYVNFVSVWCFFAAIVSLSIYKILNDNEEYLSVFRSKTLQA